MLSLNLAELLTVHKFNRDTRERNGRERNQDLMLQVYQGITNLQTQYQAWATENPGEGKVPPNFEWPIEISSVEDLWQLSRDIDADYVRGKQFCGFSLVVKIANALDAIHSSSLTDRDVNIIVEALDKEVKRNAQNYNADSITS